MGKNKVVLYAIPSLEIFKIVFITNKTAFYIKYFFLGTCFAESARNSIGPFEGSPNIPQFKGTF